MKKLIMIIIIVIIGAGIIFLLRDKSSENKTITPSTNESRNFHPDPSNATFTIDDEKITLTKGRNEKTLEGTMLVEETILLDKFAYGDINADGKQDAALFLASSGGGSGTFIYLAAYVSGLVNYKGLVATFLGDRISLESISISKGVITAKYLDRRPDEAYAVEPTVSITKQFVFKDNELVEK